MRRFVAHCTIAATVASLVAPTLVDAQAPTVQGAASHAVPAPARLDTTGMFLAVGAWVGDRIIISGQPTEKALRELKAQGVTTVVNLRMPEEMQSAVKFDEAALIKELGMKYVHLPSRGGGSPEFAYSPKQLAGFTQALKEADGKVLLHCTIAWRASHLWAAYLIQERGVPVEEALANARAINLMDDHRMGPNGRQPVEDFLNRSLPTLGRPKQ
jgi:uncharacterized protein (TIGR01244 family)